MAGVLTSCIVNSKCKMMSPGSACMANGGEVEEARALSVFSTSFSCCALALIWRSADSCKDSGVSSRSDIK